MSVPVSVVIIAKNEELRIKECLESVHGWADEIVVVDDNSTDKTREVVAQYTDKAFTRQMELEGKQRNFGASKTKNDWIFILDCDERPTPELKAEIAEVLKNGDKMVAAYWVGQINFISDFQLKHGGWSNPHIRLYNKNFMRWSEEAHQVVHPGLVFEPGYKGGNLKGLMIHYNFKHIDDFIAKVNRYSTLEAIKWHLSGRKMTAGKATWRTVDRFFRRFVGKGGYKDGYYGFVAAILSGFYEFAAYSKYKEIKEKGMYLKKA